MGRAWCERQPLTQLNALRVRADPVPRDVDGLHADVADLDALRRCEVDLGQARLTLAGGRGAAVVPIFAVSELVVVVVHAVLAVADLDAVRRASALRVRAVHVAILIVVRKVVALGAGLGAVLVAIAVRVVAVAQVIDVVVDPVRAVQGLVAGLMAITLVVCAVREAVEVVVEPVGAVQGLVADCGRVTVRLVGTVHELVAVVVDAVGAIGALVQADGDRGAVRVLAVDRPVQIIVHAVVADHLSALPWLVAGGVVAARRGLIRDGPEFGALAGAEPDDRRLLLLERLGADRRPWLPLPRGLGHRLAGVAVRAPLHPVDEVRRVG